MERRTQDERPPYEPPAAIEQGPAEGLTCGPSTRVADSPPNPGFHDLEERA